MIRRKTHGIAARLADTRGVAVVELALMLPLFLTLIAGVIEVPRLLIAQNRALNLARVAADLRSRNNGLLPAGDSLKSLADSLGGTYALGDCIRLLPKTKGVDSLKVSGILHKMFGSSISNLIGNVFSGKEYQRTFSNILGMDGLYRGECLWTIPTILPTDFLNSRFSTGWSGNRLTLSVRGGRTPVCFMPNRNCAVNSGRKFSYTEKMQSDIDGNPEINQGKQKIDKIKSDYEKTKKKKGRRGRRK